MTDFQPLPDALALASALAERCHTWNRDARLIGNLRGEDIEDLAKWVAGLPEGYLSGGDLSELVERVPNGLTERMFATAAWIHYCAERWAPDAVLVRRAEPVWGMTDYEDEGMTAGDLRRFADFVLRIPRADNEPGPEPTRAP